MARKTVHRDLPALALHPDFKPFPPSAHHLESLVLFLRGTIEQVRSNAATPFYAQREIAVFCRVPLRTVTLACRRLQAEGLLNCVRSSATFVTPRKRQPRTPVRGVVGLAVWIGGFVQLMHWREFFTELESALRVRNYVGSFVFFQGPGSDADFVEHLRRHRLDYLVWFAPLPEADSVLHAMSDGGVHVIVVDDQARASPFRQYALSCDRALARGLSEWERDGIREVFLVGATEDEDTPGARSLERLLAKFDFSFRHVPLSQEPMTQYLDDLPSRRETGIFIPSDLISSLCSRVSQPAMLSLLRRSRVMLRDSLPMVGAIDPAVRVDLLRIDWPRLAHRIAADIEADRRHDPDHPPLFHARWLPCARAWRYAERI